MKNYFFLTKHIGLPLLIALITTSLTVFLEKGNFSDENLWMAYLEYAGDLLGKFAFVPFIIIIFDISVMLVFKCVPVMLVCESNSRSNNKFYNEILECIKTKFGKCILVGLVFVALSFVGIMLLNCVVELINLSLS